MASEVHLIGSVGLNNEEDVFRMLASSVGTRARRYPDGETGERHYWIRWQQKIFVDDPDLELADDRERYRSDTPLRYYRPRAPKHSEDVSFGKLGYADAALNSFKTFARLKANGTIPHAVRFLVALPTPVAVITSFVVPAERAAIEPAYERALTDELRRICDGIPHDQLAIQWDVCHEILSADAAFPLHYPDVLEGTRDRLARLSRSIPGVVELGVHLCYGDPGHKHIKEPTDTATAVRFANSIAAGIGRRLDWIHLPVPRGRSDDAYYTPLRELRLPAQTQLVLGLVHYSDGVDGTLRRAEIARRFVQTFGVATECGFGRRDPATIPDLLAIHAQVADRL
jgi:hypothetical protein